MHSRAHGEGKAIPVSGEKMSMALERKPAGSSVTPRKFQTHTHTPETLDLANRLCACSKSPCAEHPASSMADASAFVAPVVNLPGGPRKKEPQ